MANKILFGGKPFNDFIGNATIEDVQKDKTFYSNDKTLKTGVLDIYNKMIPEESYNNLGIPATNLGTVCYGNGLFVTFKVSSLTTKAYTSPNGITWTSRTCPSGYWGSVCYGNGLFVAVANIYNASYSSIITSPDGITWTARTYPATYALSKVCYGNGLFVAVGGYDGGVIITSPDGINWSSRTCPYNGEWASVCYGNGLFVAVARWGSTSTSVMTSSDGITWTLRDSYSNYWCDIIYGNGLFVAVGNSMIVTSPDGIIWTRKVFTDDLLRYTISFSDGIFVVSGESATVSGITTSYDGINWKLVDILPICSWNSSCYGDGKFIIIEWSSPYRIIHFYPFSKKLIVNKEKNYHPVLGDFVSRTSSVTYNFNSVCYGNGLFVALASNGTYSQVVTSPDGITWTMQTLPSGSGSLIGACFGNGIFVIVGQGIKTSLDGVTWSSRTSPLSNLKSVCYGNGLFVAIARDTLVTSTDGINWTLRTGCYDTYWESVCYGNGLFVAVAYTYAMTSSDGINWVLRSSPIDHAWSSVCYGNGRFVAVSSSGVSDGIMTSSDGITWIARTAPVITYWGAVCYGVGLFVAVSSNYYMASIDGINWNYGLGQYGTGNAICYGNSKFVEVGSSIIGTSDLLAELY